MRCDALNTDLLIAHFRVLPDMPIPSLISGGFFSFSAGSEPDRGFRDLGDSRARSIAFAKENGNGTPSRSNLAADLTKWVPWSRTAPTLTNDVSWSSPPLTSQ